MAEMSGQKESIVNHEIHALFPLPYEGIQDTFDNQSIVERYKNQIRGHRFEDDWVGKFLERPVPEAKNSLWSPLESGDGVALSDFQPHIRQLLGQSDQLLLCLAFRLTAPQVLSKVKGGKPRTWEFPLGEAAKARCQKESVFVQIKDARFFLFRTGIAILDIAWKYPADDITLDGILEGNYLLSHTKYSKSAHGPEILREIAEALLPPIGDNRLNLRNDRLILYSLAQYEGGSNADDTLPTFTLRLALRQNNAYRPERDTFTRGIYQPFPYLCHAAAVEGGATVIDVSAGAPDSIQHFLSNQGRNTYLPLFVAEIHNHFWLLNQSQWLPARQSSKGSRSEKQEITKIYEATVEYRRFFSPILVSTISVHNAFHEIWQQALCIQERTRQVEEISQMTISLLQEKRTSWIGRISGSIGGFLVAREILDGFSLNGFFFSRPSVEELLASYPSLAPSVHEALINRIHIWDMVVFVGSLIGGLLGLWVSWNFDMSMKKD